MDQTADFDAILETALAWARDGRGAALATVIETWGSAPRPVGSQLAISGRAEIAGSVSGGCVEAAVVAEALEALQDGRPRLLTYGVSDEDAFAVGLACGGTIRVVVEPIADTAPALPPALLDTLAQARAARRAMALLTDLDTWDRRLIPAEDAPPPLTERFRADRSGTEGGTFTAIYNPPLRLVVVGAVHIAQPLVAMARMAGFDSFVVDPRDSFAAPHRFPGLPLSHDWPDEALTSHGLDPRTAVVTLTHDPKLDDPAILTALASPVFYIGCLGSTRTHAKRLDRLRAVGVPDGDLARLHAPVGLPIGARSPAEIGVSILAQIIERLRKG